MKVIYKLCLLGLLGILWFGSCYDDKGDYDYHAINEVTMEHEFFGDTVLRMYSFVDTLRVVPEVKGTLDENLDHYEYEWIAVGDYFDKKGVYTIGTEKVLNYPITLPAQTYSVYYNVKDKNTGLVKTERIYLKIATMFSQGWLVLGENDDGKAQLDMVATGGEDTTIMKDLLQASELHEELGKPRLAFVPPFRPNAALNYILVSTEKGTYRLDPGTMTPIDGSHLKWSYYDVSAARECVMTDVVQVMGYYRAMAVDEGLYYSYLMGTSGCFLSGASNHYRGDYSLFPFGDKIGYSPKERANAIVMYNKEKGCFVYQTYGSGPNQYFDDLKDNFGDKFSWKPGYDYVTTINTLMGEGYTYTILRDGDDFYLYGYRITPYYGIIKQVTAKMDKAMEWDMDKAEFFGGSNTLSIIYYTVGNKLYGYDFSKKKGRLLKTFDGYEITLLQSDILVETSKDYFYVALYDPVKPASTGGEIRKYTIIDDVNDIVIKEEKGSKWEGLCKVKSISYKVR